MSALSLPGKIGGLLRRGSPVVGNGLRLLISEVFEGGEVVRVEGRDVSENARHFDLDLRDVTGRAHAAWWAQEHTAADTHEEDVWGPIEKAMYGDDMTDEQIEELRDLCLRLAVDTEEPTSADSQ